MRDALGKGQVHAEILYRQWFREGRVSAEDPAFANAASLYQHILEITDFSFPPLEPRGVEGQTAKWVQRDSQGFEVESVLIPMQRGATLCISSQVGCRMGCSFCETGRMGLLRNLSVEEIVSQVFSVRFIHGQPFRNVVFMGMGEPLDNYDEVRRAVLVLTDPGGMGMAKGRVTISTSGSVPGIYRMIEEGEPFVNLAVSINAPDDDLRNRLMPINRRHPLGELKRAIHDYGVATGREVLAAYVLLQGINDSLEQADLLADYLEGLPVRVNLIPYNPQSRDRFAPPTETQFNAFFQRLRGRGLRTLRRQTKGREIMAACGQLGNTELRRLQRARAVISDV